MSQASQNVPTSGSESAITFAGQCNGAWNALASKNSGASTPANGPLGAATAYQDWMNTTSATLVKWQVFDGANWPRVGTLDVTNSIWLPKQGGGLGTIASAATTDIYAQPQCFITISGTTTITSFGSSGENGEWKKCYASGQFTITNNASITCPGGVNIITTVGDTFEVFNDGGGLTLVLNYTKGNGPAGIGMPTGATFWMYSIGNLAGAIQASGLTIGKTASGATGATGDTYWPLYKHIWEYSVGAGLGISGGAQATATVTTPIASPGVVNWTGNLKAAGDPVSFAVTGGALPTGITAGTVYYVNLTGLGANSFSITATSADALAGINRINFTGTTTGTQTGFYVPDTEIVVSGTGRGVDAATDWAALRTITLYDLRGRALFGNDKNGNTGAASRITTTTASYSGAFSGATFGAQTVTIALTNLPSTNLSLASLTATNTGGNIGIFNGAINNGASSAHGNAGGANATNSLNSEPTISFGGTLPLGGSGTATNKMPPGKVGTWYIAL